MFNCRPGLPSFLRVLTQSPDGLLHDDPENRLPPSNDDPPRNAPAKKIQCEFCECRLTNAGEVLQFSDKAKKYRHHDDEIEKRDKRVTELETQLRDANAKLAEHVAAVGGGRGELLL